MNREPTSAEKRNMINFFRRHIDEEDFYSEFDLDTEEIRFVCPFCGGGSQRAHCFDFNIQKGVGRCWRKNNCGWTGGFPKFLMDTLHIDFPQALAILRDEESYNSVVIKDDLNRFIRRTNDRMSRESIDTSFEQWYPGCIDVFDSPLCEDILHWIQYERGYDSDRFLEDHELLVPPQIGVGEGRVCFVVRTGDNIAYQLYRFDNAMNVMKTWNAPGQYLSRMLYNYNNVISEKDMVFVCEGIFDAARLISWGLSAVCTFGVNIQDYQMFLISELDAKEIVLYYDYGTNDVVVGDLKKPEKKSLLQRVTEACPDKTVSFIEIEATGGDPDDTSQELFIDYFQKRKQLERKEVVPSLMSRINKWKI